ncbi:CNNM domain-containing protein, partial [Mycobacterium sp.]|uniref:CNNM domain-containing protein n=1 Tax=Mycobacterium sp. TaxID=1785 RepID=UPI003BAE50A7
MNLVVTLLSLLAIALLTAGTALFVAAEFSFTTLERSTVDANARNGRRRDRWVRRAHHTLSFQLSGAQLGISVTTLITGYLTEPLVAELPHPAMDALGVPDRVANALVAFVTLLVVTSLSMIFGELVPKNLAVARPLQTARAVAGLQLLFSWLMTGPIRLTNG